MAKIPAFVSTARLERGNVVQYPTGSPVGEALERAGSAISEAGARAAAALERAEQRNEELDNFKLSRGTQLLNQQLNGDLDAAETSMPADASGFHDGFAGELDTKGNPLKPGAMEDRIKAAREALPESVRPKFDAYMPEVRQQFSNLAADRERKGRTNYYRTELAKLQTDLENSISQIDPTDAKSFEAYREQGIATINASGLDAGEKAELVAKWRVRASETVGMNEARINPQGLKDRLGVETKKPNARTDIRGGGGNEEASYRFFIGKGYTPQQAAGIVGNLQQESGAGLNTRAVHDSGTGYGIAGWRDDPRPGGGKRRTALLNFARKNNLDPSSLATQLEFVHHELNSSEGSVGAKLKNAKTAKEAAEAFIGYERPRGWTPDNPRGGHGWRNRADNAVRVLGRHGGKEGLTEDFVTAGDSVTDRADPMYQDIPLERRIVLANYADKVMTQRQQDAAAARKLAEDNVVRDGYDLVSNETLNDDWIEENRDTLSPALYHTFKAALDRQEKGSGDTDTVQYQQLFERAVKDPDQDTVQDDAFQMFGEGKLKKTDFNRIFNLSRSTQKVRETPFIGEIRKSLAARLSPLDREDTEQYENRLDGLFALDDWIGLNPKATRDEVKKKANEIAKQYTEGIDLRAGLDMPQYTTVGRYKLDAGGLQVAAQKLSAAYKAGKLTAEELKREAALLRKWQTALEEEGRNGNP